MRQIFNPARWSGRQFFGAGILTLILTLLIMILMSSSPAESSAGKATVTPVRTITKIQIVEVPMHWIVGPANLKGGKESSTHQAFAYAKHLKLPFVSTVGKRKELVKAGKLKKLTGTKFLKLSGVSEPYLLPATHTFTQRLAKQYSQVKYTDKKDKVRTCGKLVATSALRLPGKQPPNASRHSVHPTGMAIDLRIPTVPECRSWLEDTLLEIEQSGRIDATQERSPPHYHVVVITKTYVEDLRKRGLSFNFRSDRQLSDRFY